MGSRNSKYNELKNEIDNIKLHFTNVDQIREEYEEKMTENKIELKEAYDKIDELTKELEYYKNYKPNNFIVSTDENQNNIDLNNQRIDELVDKILDDKNINCSFLPDVVEKQIYKNVLTIGLELLKQTLENSKINFIGHEIKFTITPSSEKLGT